MTKQSILLAVLSLAFFSVYLEAKDLKASLSFLPKHLEVDDNGKLSGGFVEVVNAINDVYLHGNISVKVYPFARSLMNIESGHADFHLPMIKHANTEKRLPYVYASECITKVAFVLYSRADRAPLNMQRLDQYTIDTQRGHKLFFPFDIMENNSLEQGIQKLLKGRIDGYIMEQDAVDDYIRINNLSNIRRTLYREWNSCVVIP